MKISNPIPIKITPPKIDAFPASLVPNFRPRHSPAMQIANVTVAISSDATSAITQS